MNTRIETLLGVFDDAWSHPFEGLLAALEGVTDEESSWQAPYYRSEDPEAGMPPVGSVIWHLEHVRRCKVDYAATLRDEPMLDFESSDGASFTFESVRAALGAAHDEHRAALAALDDDALRTRRVGDMSLEEFVRANIRHDVWHGGQIAVARRAWRVREG